MYYTTDAHIDAYLREQEAAEEAHYAAVEEFGEDYEQNEVEDEDRTLIPESWVSTVSQQDRDDLQAVLDWEAFEGFGS